MTINQINYVDSLIEFSDSQFSINSRKFSCNIAYSDVKNIRITSHMTVKSFFGKKTFDINLKDGKSICLFFKKKSFFNFSEKDDNTIITILNMCDEFSKRGIDVSLVAGNYGLMIFSLTVIIFCCLSLLFFLLNKNLNPKPIFYYLLGGLIVKAILLFIQSRVFTISHDYMHRDNSKKALIWGS